MSDYKYVCPTTGGYRKFKISRKNQNEIFKYRKAHWAYNYEYYVKDETIKMYKVPNIWGCIASTVLFPIGLLSEGFSNYKEVYNDMVLHTWQCKKYGKFSSDAIYQGRGESFDKVMGVAMYE